MQEIYKTNDLNAIAQNNNYGIMNPSGPMPVLLVDPN